MDKKLTPKQLLFIEEYLVDKNATRAAIAAGYSEKTAYTIGQENTKKPQIKSEIERRLAAQTQVVENIVAAKLENVAEEIFTKEMWLRELKKIAMVDMDDYVKVEDVIVQNGNFGDERTVTKVIFAQTKDRVKGSGAAIKKIAETKNGLSIEFHSKSAALETIGKHYGWLKQEVNLSTEDDVQLHLVLPDNGRLAKKEEK